MTKDGVTVHQSQIEFSVLCCKDSHTTHENIHYTSKLVHFSYFHFIMSYGFVFWANSTDSKKVFNFQKKIIRIMVGFKRRVLQRTVQLI